MLTVQETLKFYYFEHIAKKSVARRRAEEIMAALNRHLGDKPIRDIDIPACRAYADERYEEGVVSSTVRRELGVLQAAAHHNKKWRRLKHDDMPSIELTAESPSKKTWLFQEELATLLETAATNDRRVFRFLQIAYHTAARKQSVESLSWQRVDLQTRRIDLQNPDLPVTKKRCPIVPISEAMAAELQELADKATSNFVLVTDADIRPAFDRITKLSGLEILPKSGLREAGRLTPHVLRHSRATHLLQAGKSPWAVAGLLGDTLATVLRVYGHVCDKALEDVVT